MKHILFKVTEGKQNDWRSWCEYLRDHELQAKETMRTENCVYERSVMYEREGSYYVVGTSQFNGDPKKADLDIELNLQHVNVRQACLSKSIAVFEGAFELPPTHEVLYEFDLR